MPYKLSSWVLRTPIWAPPWMEDSLLVLTQKVFLNPNPRHLPKLRRYGWPPENNNLPETKKAPETGGLQ